MAAGGPGVMRTSIDGTRALARTFADQQARFAEIERLLMVARTIQAPGADPVSRQMAALLRDAAGPAEGSLGAAISASGRWVQDRAARLAETARADELTDT